MNRPQSYAACPRPRRVTNTHAVWEKPDGEPGIIAGAMLLAAVFAIGAIIVAAMPDGPRFRPSDRASFAVSPASPLQSTIAKGGK